MTDCSAIVAFLEGEGPDGWGRNVLDVIAFGDVRLETTHDYIQWLFPLAEPSEAMPGSPVLTPDDVATIRESDMAQCALAAGVDRMSAFYLATHDWLMPNDHNHRRITRIIRSLRLLVDDAAAESFRAMILGKVEATRAPISARSLGYWMTA